MFALLYHFQNLISRVQEDKSGASAAEYGLLVALIAVVIITAVTALGNGIATTFNTVATQL